VDTVGPVSHFLTSPYLYCRYFTNCYSVFVLHVPMPTCRESLTTVWLLLFQCVLHYMVRSKEAVGGVSREVVDILLHAGLIKK